jgi:hypothetical protein
MVNSERAALPLSAAKLVDAATRERVLVLGSYPPTGRDLDILARPAAREEIGAALAREGFIARGPALAPARSWVQQWVRFSDGTAFAVDVHQPERYGLPDAGVAALFDDAVPIEGMERLVRCAPHHVLLMIARGLARRGLAPSAAGAMTMRSRTIQWPGRARKSWRTRGGSHTRSRPSGARLPTTRRPAGRTARGPSWR